MVLVCAGLAASGYAIVMPPCRGRKNAGIQGFGTPGARTRTAEVYDGLPGLYQKQQADTGMCDGHLSLGALN